MREAYDKTQFDRSLRDLFAANMPHQEFASLKLTEQGSSAQNIVRLLRDLGMNTHSLHDELFKHRYLTNFREQTLQALSLAQVPLREVQLLEGWSQRESDPMLGFTGERERAVILRYQDEAWWLEDQDRREVVDEAKLHANGLSRLALQIYPPLKPERLTLKELVDFGLKVSTQDVSRGWWLMLGTSLLGALLPYFSRSFVSDVMPYNNFELAIVLALAMLAAVVTRTLFNVVLTISRWRVEVRFEQRIMTALFERLLHLPASFFKQYASGELTTRLSGLMQVRLILSNTLTSVVMGAAFGIVSLIPVLLINGSVVLLICLILCVLGGFHFYCARRLIHYMRQTAIDQGQNDGWLYQLLMGMPKIQVTGSEKLAFSLWADKFKALNLAKRDLAQWDRWNFTASFLLTSLSTMVLYAFLLRIQGQDGPGHLSVGDFVAISLAFGQLMGAMGSLAGALIRAQAAWVLIERARCFIDHCPEPSSQKFAHLQIQGDIQLRHVSFGYEKDSALVIHDLTCHIQRGELVVIVGESGCGKSTLLRLLLGFEVPTSGEILYDGFDLNGIDQTGLRRQIGVVVQQGRLMAGSIYDNVVADSGLGLTEVLRVIDQVGLTQEMAQLPMGVLTEIQDGAPILSGGQKQRLLLARALIHQPPIVIFDEAMSFLDEQSQDDVMQTIQQLDCTRVLISHQLSVIQKADRIVMMRDGRLVASGSYHELLKNNEWFAAYLQHHFDKDTL